MENSVRISKKSVLIYVFLFAAITKITVGALFTNTFDVFWYRDWILDMQNGLFTIYSRAAEIQLDYPPLFLVLTYPISLLYRIVPPDTYAITDMLFMKLLPIIFDLLSGVIIYHTTKNDEKIGVIAVIFWLLNPAVFFNSVMWGQTDSFLAFFILLTFLFIIKKRPVISTVMFACACMIKFQCAFLAPVFLIAIIDILKDRKFKETLYCIIAGFLTVAIVFLPFSIGANDPLLIFKVYFGSTGKYPYCTVNAANLYALINMNWQSHSENFIFGISYNVFGYIMLVLGIVFTAFVWFKGNRKCVFLSSVFLMQHIFIFMTDMHERYQFVILPLLLVVWALYKNANHLKLLAGYTVTILLNQWFVLANFIQKDVPWQNCFNLILAIIAAFNIILYCFTIYETIKFSFDEA